MLCQLKYNEATGLWECPNCDQGPLRNAKGFKRQCKFIDRSPSVVLTPKKKTRPKSRYHEVIAPRTNSNGCYAGTELKRLLKRWLRISGDPGCKCNSRATLMDERGCDWCEKNIEQVIDWLEEEAKRRKLPFARVGGKILIQRAIKNAKRNVQK